MFLRFSYDSGDDNKYKKTHNEMNLNEVKNRKMFTTPHRAN